MKKSGTRTGLEALKYASRLWMALDTPVSLACHLLAKYGEYEQLVRKEIDPRVYRSPGDFFRDYQSTKLLAKYPYLDTGINRTAVAQKKFIEAEVRCRDTNTLFRMRANGDLTFRPLVESVLSNARAKIAHILGKVPTLEEMDFSFGPGATYGVRGETSVFNKVSATLECTYAFTDRLQEFLEEFPGWVPEGIHDVRVIPGSQLTFVLKDAKTDRPICIEPLLNGLYQKGVGTWIRRRLMRFGINLDDQGINQKLASLAHVLGLSTVDFTSASDMIAYLLVQDLLPIDWFEFLDVARCPRYEFEGRWYNFHKFSSMGNAYTFELETLIFYALATSCCEAVDVDYASQRNLHVYGDDVIIPREAFDLFSEVTDCCGFEVNKKKSFRDGTFFESCGHDYLNGTLVRPFFLRRKTDGLLPTFHATNTVIRLASRLADAQGVLDRSTQASLVDLLHYCANSVPRRLRRFGPEGYGDGHLIAPQDVVHPTRHRHSSGVPSGWDGWVFQSWSETAIKKNPEGGFPTAYGLYATRLQRKLNDWPGSQEPRVSEPTDNGSGYTVRGVTKLRVGRQFCFGAWDCPTHLFQ